MKIIATPIGNEYGLDKSPQQTDIISVGFDFTGLRIIVGTSPKNSFEDLAVEYFFQNPRGFRLLDELDIYRYWHNETFSSHHHLYEIISGGWLEQEKQLPETLVTSQGTKEWFIKTSNNCMNVLSTNAPLIRELLK